MALTVEDVQTFVTLLEQNRELRKQVERVLFPELDINNSLERLARLLERMDSRVASQERALSEFKTETRQNFAEAKADRDILRHDIGTLKGLSKEAFYHRRAPAIFGRYVTKGREVSNRVADQLQLAFEQNLITDDDYEQVLAADMFWEGKLRQTNQDILLVMEASWYVQTEDVQRAVDRAAICKQGGLPALPIVGGEEWADEALALATERAVAITLDGRLERVSWQRAVKQWLAENVGGKQSS